MDQATLVQSVVEEVMNRLDGAGASTSQPVAGRASAAGRLGQFTNVDEAVEAATDAQQRLAAAGIETRDGICKLIKKIVIDNAEPWGKLEFDETKLGRLDHKVAKLELLAEIPGVEFLQTTAHSGDEGVSLDEMAPWGVLGVITPSTHSIPTITANAINMLAAGNSMVINPHPSGAKCGAEAVRVYNEAIAREFGIDNLICIITEPTLRTAEEIFRHEGVPLLAATGGPGVARAAMKQPKRAVVAGPGNPPVVVDETADLDHAAKSIIQGGGFDNNLLCIGEKEVFVVERVFEQMMAAMERAGAVKLEPAQVDRLTEVAFETEGDHIHVAKQYIGKDAAVLAEAAGASAPATCELVFGETDESNPFVPEEQMMPFVPFVRVPDVDTAIDLAIQHEHGFGHTAIIHSNNLETITRMGRVMNTTIFVANGPSTAGLGVGGEGYPSYSIATPTGEGITNPMTFTRFRRGAVSHALRFV